MSYRIYTSDAFIISARQSKDADLSVFAFTETFGLLHATAKSARHIKSKLRYSLQSLTFGSLSMVKGREIWRVTSAKKSISLYDKRIPPEARVLLVRILSHVERFCPREQPEPAIFDMLKSFSGFVFKDVHALASSAGLEANCMRLEKIFLLKLMHELGYVSADGAVGTFVKEKTQSSLMHAVGNMTDEEEREIDKAIDRAIVQSHL